jgi:hypothetical protein
MNRSLVFISFLCVASLASAATPSPTPKLASPKSSAPAALAAGQNSVKGTQGSGDTKVLRTYKGPGYFDADLALKLKDRLAGKAAGSSPANGPSPAATQRPVVNGASLVSQNR